MSTWEPGEDVVELPDGRRVKVAPARRRGVALAGARVLPPGARAARRGVAAPMGAQVYRHGAVETQAQRRWVEEVDVRRAVGAGSAAACLMTCPRRSGLIDSWPTSW